MMKTGYLRVSGTIFGLVALLQAARVIQGWSVQIGPLAVPIWFSWLAALAAGALCVWAFRTR